MLMEKETTGIYLSGHPLEKYREKLYEVCNIRSSDLMTETEGGSGHISEDVHDNMNVTLAGVVTQIKKKTTKNNTMMAFVTVEDLYGSFELLVFPKVYTRVAYALQPESIVVVRGRLSLREDDTPKVLPDEIQPIDAFFELSRMEGIIPAIESSHAVAYGMKLARTMGKGSVLINLSGRGDKDMDYIIEKYGIR